MWGKIKQTSMPRKDGVAPKDIALSVALVLPRTQEDSSGSSKSEHTSVLFLVRSQEPTPSPLPWDAVISQLRVTKKPN